MFILFKYSLRKYIRIKQIDLNYEEWKKKIQKKMNQHHFIIDMNELKNNRHNLMQHIKSNKKELNKN